MHEEMEYEEMEEMTNGESWSIIHYLITFMDLYGLAFLDQCVSVLYAIYLRITLFNLVVYFLKYVPTGIYTYQLIKNIILKSRERQMELEDIQLQIPIMNTKLCVREAEFAERAEALRRPAARLRLVRARVRDIIAADDKLRQAIRRADECDAEFDRLGTPQDDNDFINELQKVLNRDYFGNTERNLDKMSCGEHAEGDPTSDQNSFYSSVNDMNVHQDCSVKIIKVTYVYKGVYLKHYIKQKKLRRANKRAALKRKMESIKKLLEDWQRTLNMVINSKLTILNIDAHPIDVNSQEAMGDYTKPREFSDTDSDIRNDTFYDEYSLSWTLNPYRPYLYNYEFPDTAVSREYFEPQDNGDMRHSPPMQCEYLAQKPTKMMAIVEETGSQMAIEEITSDGDEYRDYVAI